jgi:glycosyltransferase involved in cell wall biosynthesis
MKIVIDLSPLRSGHQYRGIGVYTRNLFKALKKYDTKNQYVLTTKTYQAQADIIHYPFFDFFFLTLPFNKADKTVITIHDVIPLIYRDHYPAGIRGKLKFSFQKQSLRGVKRIITDSEQSKHDIEKYLNQPSDKVKKVYLAADERFKPVTKSVLDKMKLKYDIQGSYILYVGDVNYNKNILGLINAYAQAKIPQKLILVSKALGNNIEESNQIKQLIQRLDLEGKVLVLSNVPLEPLDDITSLYTGADFYIQPSFYEGFGFPVLEAWACNTMVVSSKGGSLNEVVGEAGITFNPLDEFEFKTKLRQAAHMSIEERRSWQQKGRKRLAQFSWEKTARETAKIYQELLHE